MNNQTIQNEIPKTIREKTKREQMERHATAPVAEQKYAIWYDARKKKENGPDEILERLESHQYTGVIFNQDTPMAEFNKAGSLTKIIYIESDLDRALEKFGTSSLIVQSKSEEVLQEAKAKQVPTCLHAYVDSSQSLHSAIERGKAHPYLQIQFRDPTNIPLELVIASLQASGTVLLNEISDPRDVEAALVVLGVMEFGADGVVFSPNDKNVLDAFSARISDLVSSDVDIAPAKVIKNEPVGMGYRSCVDLATMFEPTEGMIVGSTSQGGILCCPEVFHLPYMDLRPFRINAGGVHSYIFGRGNRTNYLTELKAGSESMIVGLDGKTRRGVVGRIKTELRPLRCIELEFAEGESINIIMQDDWHVRVFGADGQPKNITELKIGDSVLAHKAEPGRHVGIKVDEEILEV